MRGRTDRKREKGREGKGMEGGTMAGDRESCGGRGDHKAVARMGTDNRKKSAVGAWGGGKLKEAGRNERPAFCRLQAKDFGA